jgi:fatty acid desaturase
MRTNVLAQAGTPSTSPQLTADTLDAIAADLDAIHREIRNDLGEDDIRYIRRIIALQRGLDAGGRCLLLVARFTPAMVAGTAMLAAAKTLENVEIGHSVVHGQWDWMRDPKIHSSTWEWDAVWTSEPWRRSHNYRHHTFTNVVGLDRDLGYSSLRVMPEQPWRPVYLLQPIYAVLMGALFEWAIALYDLELDEVRAGKRPWREARAEFLAFLRKASRQVAKDYVVLPILARRSARRALIGSVVANVARSLWTQTIVYCGHIPGGPHTFSQEQFADEDKGGRYVRQLTGSCNIEGGAIFNVASGHLGFQIEHHLFPALPSNRYPQIAKEVRQICERHGLPYETGSLRKQYGAVVKRILRLALPGPRLEPAPR